MPNTCKVCRHPKRTEIEQLMLNGEALRGIEKRFRLSDSTLARHKAKHLTDVVLRARDATETIRSERVVEDVLRQVSRIAELLAEGEAILKRASRSKDTATALEAIRTLASTHREARASFELIARLRGELAQAEEPRQQVLILMPWDLPERDADIVAAIDTVAEPA